MTTYTAGYTCAYCGQRVLGGSIHYCGTRWVNPPPMPDPALERIATALERLADILERRPAA